MENQKISVVLVGLGNRELIEMSLRSVVRQSFSPTEIVVVFDESKFDPSVLNNEFSEKKLKFVSVSSAAPADILNAGINGASGDFIAFLQAGDLWHPEKLAHQMPLFDDLMVGVVYAPHQFIPIFKNQSKKSSGVVLPRGWVSGALMKKNCVNFSSAVIRRECVDVLGGASSSARSEILWDMWLRYAVQFKFDHADIVLVDVQSGPFPAFVKSDANADDQARVLSEFVRTHGDFLMSQDVRDAMVLNLNHLGRRNQGVHPFRSIRYYSKSIQRKPFQMAAYKGILLSPVPKVGDRPAAPLK